MLIDPTDKTQNDKHLANTAVLLLQARDELIGAGIPVPADINAWYELFRDDVAAIVEKRQRRQSEIDAVEQKRQTALAKLSEEDRRLLNLPEPKQ